MQIMIIVVGIVFVCVNPYRFYDGLMTIVDHGTCVEVQAQIPDHPEMFTHRNCGVSDFLPYSLHPAPK